MKIQKVMNLFLNSKIRESFIYALKRVTVGHIYDEELKELYYLVDTRQEQAVKDYCHKLLKLSRFLEPATIRASSISSFLSE